jgi:hypothetical protein
MKQTNMNDINAKNCGVPQWVEGFIGKAEVARRIGRTVRTVDLWMKRGLLPYYKPDRSVLFRWVDVEQHIVANYRVVRAPDPAPLKSNLRTMSTTRKRD